MQTRSFAKAAQFFQVKLFAQFFAIYSILGYWSTQLENGRDMHWLQTLDKET